VSRQPEDDLPLDQRQAIFLALVESQDGGMTVATSRTEIARRFSVSENQVKDIEREGLSNQWPPLE
jgi:HD superfamily phosphodiesterase